MHKTVEYGRTGNKHQQGDEAGVRRTLAQHGGPFSVTRQLNPSGCCEKLNQTFHWRSFVPVTKPS
jgi:hypothetical protein